jgi:hypothetical protein
MSGEAENLYHEEESVDVSSGPERRVSNEFAPLTIPQHLDYFGGNFLDLFGDGSRKGSSSNLQPLDESGNVLNSFVYCCFQQVGTRATNWKVVGSRPDEVNFFNLPNPSGRTRPWGLLIL